MSGKKKRRALVWGLLVLALFAIAEWVYTIRLRSKLRHEFVATTSTSFGRPLSRRPGNFEFVTDPFTVIRIRPGQRYRDCRINRWGYRSREFEQETPEGTYRIVLTGGSAAFGLNMFDDSRMFDRLLERGLNSRGDGGYEVINAGVPGYTSSNEVSLIVHDLLRFGPRMVINFTGWNDFYIPHFTRDNRPEKSHTYEQFEALMARGTLHTFFDRSLTLASLERRILRAADRLRGEPPMPDWRYLQASIDRFEYNMATVAGLCEAFGIAHLIVLQPEESHRRTPCEAEVRDLEQYGPAYAAAVARSYEGFRRAGTEVARRFAGTEFVDLSRVFDAVEGCIWIDFVHFDPSGHEVVARALETAIASVAVESERSRN